MGRLMQESSQSSVSEDGSERHSIHKSSSDVETSKRKAPIIIALGSNVGDRVEAIEEACQAIDSHPDMELHETSFLYETVPMYVTEQEPFLNGVCTISTTLEPLALLDQLQALEKGLGRVKLIEKGPRRIDLDIIAYGKVQMQTERLTIPHPLTPERDFVLRPLCDRGMPSKYKLHYPARKVRKTAQQLFHALKGQSCPQRVSVLSNTLKPLHPTDPKRRTQVMAILNTTPDSFSDGGKNPVSDIEALRALAAAHIEAGAAIIDIGGQSSRPGAPDTSPEEEIARVLPAIEAIKSLPQATNIAISVDTYRASVAKAAVEAGAHIVNDISAGVLDPAMLETVKDLGCTYIMMHMRGTPATMSSEANCTYPSGVIESIEEELDERVRLALALGIPRWRIVLDPGVGFSKTAEQNLEILSSMDKLRNGRLRGFPWLVGSSRKGFIGRITGVKDASKRAWGTAATTTAAIQGGADIVRIHDVREMVEVVKVSDAIYRGLGS
ncbi:Dihydropteroate synthase [Polychaeton citri CBS 116435]|uniref:Folic acid synthesis protein FOL1 n=1 Tax=Polychaeton citri CBS 116435 TaxID=1314669 RepID=A0A9P4QHI3_9PEZI|nr:Dihydropteroate synthase [Polychaeton citri CBS 116435]